MPQITITLSDTVMTKVQQEAQQQGISSEEWMQTAIIDSLDDDTPEEEILANFKIGMKEALSGQTMDWDETMALLRQEFAVHANED